MVITYLDSAGRSHGRRVMNAGTQIIVEKIILQ